MTASEKLVFRARELATQILGTWALPIFLKASSAALELAWVSKVLEGVAVQFEVMTYD